MNDYVLLPKNLDYLHRTIARHCVWSKSTRNKISNRRKKNLQLPPTNTTTPPLPLTTIPFGRFVVRHVL